MRSPAFISISQKHTADGEPQRHRRQYQTVGNSTTMTTLSFAEPAPTHPSNP